MSQSGMVERVARAIYEADDPWHVAFPWPGLSEKQAGVEAYRRCARAAIEAMREPDKSMVLAGDDAKEGCIDSGWSSDSDGNAYDYTTINSDLPAIVWRAMIDAALSEEVK